jgi:hypothetical protein
MRTQAGFGAVALPGDRRSIARVSWRAAVCRDVVKAVMLTRGTAQADFHPQVDFHRFPDDPTSLK